MVFPDGDPALAAKPGFHDQAPSGVEVVAGPLGHTLNILPVLLENFTENLFPGGRMEAEPASGIVVKLAGG